jgi:plasmid stabilization system protein ParE
MSAVVWTKGALASLEKQRRFLAETDPDFANQAVRQIVAAADSLEQFPKRGAIVSQAAGLRKLMVPFTGSAFVIHYAVVNDEVLIWRVYHGRQQRPI